MRNKTNKKQKQNQPTLALTEKNRVDNISNVLKGHGKNVSTDSLKTNGNQPQPGPQQRNRCCEEMKIVGLRNMVVEMKDLWDRTPHSVLKQSPQEIETKDLSRMHSKTGEKHSENKLNTRSPSRQPGRTLTCTVTVISLEFQKKMGRRWCSNVPK